MNERWMWDEEQKEEGILGRMMGKNRSEEEKSIV
jgi:hypothetical protein